MVREENNTMPRNYFSRMLRQFCLYSGLRWKEIVWVLATLLMVYCFVEIYKPVYFHSFVPDVLFTIPLEAGNRDSSYFGPVKWIDPSPIVSPIDFGTTFLPLHLLVAFLAGWTLFHWKRALIHSDELRLTPGVPVPGNLLWFVACCIALYAFVGWGVYDVIYPLQFRVNSIWGTHLYSTDPAWIGVNVLSGKLPLVYFVKGVVFFYLIAAQSYLVLLSLSRYVVEVPVIGFCLYSVFRNMVYMVNHGFCFSGYLRSDGDPLSFLYREIYRDLIFWSVEVVITSIVLFVVVRKWGRAIS